MPAKIALDPEKLPALRAVHDAILPLYKSLDETEATLARMRTDETALKSDISRMEESTDYTDAAGSLNLKGKIAQLELLQRQAVKVENNLPHKTNELAAHLDTLNTLIPHATKPELERVTARIKKSLGPVFGADDELLSHVLTLTPEFTDYTNFFHRRWFEDGNRVTQRAADALAVLAALIAGENPWAFTRNRS